MNNYQSKSVVWGRTFMNEFLAAIATRPAAALIAAGKIRLTVDPTFAPTPDMTLASAVSNEANYSGYAAGGIAAVFTVALNISPSIQGAIASALFEATPAGPFVSAVVTGYWLDDGTNIVIAERFAQGATAAFSAAGDFLDLTTVLPLGLAQVAA
jgi:hypothetical protein